MGFTIYQFFHLHLFHLITCCFYILLFVAAILNLNSDQNGKFLFCCTRSQGIGVNRWRYAWFDGDWNVSKGKICRENEEVKRSSHEEKLSQETKSSGSS